MSLTAALNNSLSGLQVSQSALALVAQNVANANTPEYSRKIAELQPRVVGNTRSGVEIVEISRIVNQYLMREVRATHADMGRYSAQQPFLGRLQVAFGEPGNGNSLVSRMDQIFAAFDTVAGLPNSSIARRQAVLALSGLTSQINSLYGEIETLRTDADRELANQIGEVNQALVRIEELNTVIARESLGGGDATEFLDLRDAQLRIVSERVAVTLFTHADNRIAIYAGTGVPLLEETARILDYDPSGLATPQTFFDRIEVFQRDANGAPTGTGLFVEHEITGGRLRGLIDLRDQTLPQLSSTLGELAARIADEFNRIHNDNTGFPPPNTLTGSRVTGMTAADAHNFTGRMTFSVINPNLPVVDGYGVTATVTVDFSAGTVTPNFGAPVAVALATFGDVIAAVNGVNGLNGAGTLSLAGGILALSATAPGNRVAVAQDAAAPSNRAGRGFAHFFGLNDLITSTMPQFTALGFAAGDAHQFAGLTTFTVLDSAKRTVATVSYNAGLAPATFAGLVGDLNAQLAPYASFAFDAATGGVTMTPASGYSVLARDEASASRGGTAIGMATLLGFGEDKRQSVAADLAVNSAIASDVTRLGLAKLQGAAIGDYAVTTGDNRGALRLAELADNIVPMAAAGLMPAQSLTLSAYAATLIGAAALESNQVDGFAEEYTSMFNALDLKAKQISAVNIDEELSSMIVLQNSYAASARLISSINQMYDQLLDMV